MLIEFEFILPLMYHYAKNTAGSILEFNSDEMLATFDQKAKNPSSSSVTSYVFMKRVEVVEMN